MAHVLEARRNNAKDAALVAVGVPVVLFDRVSDQLNTRLDLDSYVELARERGEHALDGYGKQVHGVARRIRSVVRPAVIVGTKIAEPMLHSAGRLVPDPIEARLGAALLSAKHLVVGVAEQIAPAKTAPAAPVAATAAAAKKPAAKKAPVKKPAAKKAPVKKSVAKKPAR
jgi:hypothetical protein